MLKRREALRILGNAALLGAIPQGTLLALLGDSRSRGDEEIFQSVLEFAATRQLSARPIGEVVEQVGMFFLNTPYTPHTLEVPGEECLVVNLRELDCTTFMENALVLARCVKKNVKAFEGYRQELTFVRYRHGIIDGYPSRLHYLTDWIWDNAAKKVLRDMGRSLGGKRSAKRIDFMTTHTDSYRQMGDADAVRQIADVEKRMNRRGFSAVPKARVPAILHHLQSGDIIGTVTTMKGMDVSHTGLIAREGGVPRFLHAPLSGGKVTLAEGSLADYLQKNPGVTGIVVARPLEPQ